MFVIKGGFKILYYYIKLRFRTPDSLNLRIVGSTYHWDNVIVFILG